MAEEENPEIELKTALEEYERAIGTLFRSPIVKTLRAYSRAYEELTEAAGVSTLERLIDKLKKPNGICAEIIRKTIDEQRQKFRPDLETPLKLKDDYVRELIAKFRATDFETELGKRIKDLEYQLHNALAPKTLREHIVRVAKEGPSKETIGNVFMALFNGAKEGTNVCFVLSRDEVSAGVQVTEGNFGVVADNEGVPFMAVLSSPDSKRYDGGVGIVNPLSLVMRRLEQYETLGGIVLDPWDDERLWLPRKNLLDAWGRFNQC